MALAWPFHCLNICGVMQEKEKQGNAAPEFPAVVAGLAGQCQTIFLLYFTYHIFHEPNGQVGAFLAFCSRHGVRMSSYLVKDAACSRWPTTGRAKNGMTM